MRNLLILSISLAAGALIATGGLLRRPEIWLAVPPLVLIRFTRG